MRFTADETCTIVKKHIASEWGVPESAIQTVQMYSPRSAHPYVEAEIKTEKERGGPYRSKPKVEKT